MAKKPGENTGKNGGIYQEVGPRGGKKDNFCNRQGQRKASTNNKARSWLGIG